MPLWLWGIVGLYVVGRSLGKMGGAYWGARLKGAPREVRLYGGLGLFAQGGVAVGLSIMASQHLGNIPVAPGMTAGDLIIFTVTATTLIVQIIGPPLVKLALKKSNEIGRNVTEDDIFAEWAVKNAMDEKTAHIREEEPLSRVIETFSDNDAISYPVVDREDKMIGIINLERLKNVLSNQDTWNWLVASDIMIPAAEKVYASTPLKDAVVLMEQLRFEQIPVVQSAQDDRAVGVLDLHKVKKLISEEVLRRRE